MPYYTLDTLPVKGFVVTWPVIACRPLYYFGGEGVGPRDFVGLEGCCWALWGMVLHGGGVAWHGMVLHGMVLHGMVLHGMVWCCMAWHGMAWHGMVLHGMMLHGMACF